MRTVSLIAIALLTLALFILELYGMHLYLFWTYWWFDILMHALGGFIVGALAVWFFIFEYPIHSARLLFYSVLVALVVGIVWEIFEYVTGISVNQAQQSYAADTIGDIGMDVACSLTAYLVFRLFIHE